MPEVSVVVELRVTVEERPDPLGLELAIAAEGRRAARELFTAALVVIDEAATAASGGARQRTEPRWVATTVGRVRACRHRVRTADRSFHPLDEALGLGQAEASPALREMVCDLATRMPYRQVAEVASRLTGEHLSHQSAWRVLRGEGARIRDDEARLVEAIFALGEAPPEPVRPPTLVVAEADGTYLRAQRESGRSFEVKTGVAYTGKRRAGGRRHPRWALVGKLCHATTADADGFGMAFATRAIHALGLHRVPHLLVAHDGLDEFGSTFRDYFPGAVHQVDHFHLDERLWEAAGANERRFRWLKARAFADPARLARGIRQGRVVVHGRRAEDLPGYLEAVAKDLWGILRLPAELRRGRMRIVGTGVVEKHQDLLVKRRMRGRGMRWTRRGADDLLALICLRASDDWPTRWGVIAE